MAALVAAGAIMGTHHVKAYALPSLYDSNPFLDFQSVDRAAIGPDGNERFVWDIFQGTTYVGSNLWILNAAGQNIGAGNTMIPASVGTGLYSSRISNTAIHVYPSNNTQVVFAFYDATTKQVKGFGTWTFNANGTLIAAAGPFSFAGTHVENLTFDADKVVVKWLDDNSANSVWVLDEFGTVTSTAGPYGPFGSKVFLGRVALEPSTGNQLWHWLIETQTSLQVTTWTVDPAGTIIATSSFGQF